jgi:glutamine amidotransferase
VTRPVRVAVIDYGIGNLRSAQKALETTGADALLTGDALLIESADAVVLPGVGSFGSCMAALRERGLDATVTDAVAAGMPFLGVCVGMQMLFEGSAEDEGVAGLGLLGGRVEPVPAGVPRPQMQWNVVEPVMDDEVLGAGREWMYFVHSYRCVPTDPGIVASTCRYGGDITAAVRKENVRAVQFHPEKSGAAGLALLGRFVVSVAPR